MAPQRAHPSRLSLFGSTKYGSVARFRAGSATIGSGVLRLRVPKASPDMSVRLRKVPNPPGHNRGSGSQRSCVLHTRDVRSAQPLAERMTLQPVVTRDDPTYKTGKHATRRVCIHTCACAAVHGTLTPVLHLTTLHPPQFALPRRSCRGGARSATIPGCWSPLR